MGDWVVSGKGAPQSDWVVTKPPAPAAAPDWNTGEGLLTPASPPSKDPPPPYRPQPDFFSPEGGGTVRQRLDQGASAVSSGLDTLSFGGYSGLNRLFGDPFNVDAGIKKYRQEHPDLHGWTDAAMMGPAALEVEGLPALAQSPLSAAAKGVESLLPAVKNRVAQVARTAIAGGGTGAVAGGTTAAMEGGSPGEVLDAAKGGGAAGFLMSGGLAAGTTAAGAAGEAVMSSKGGQARQTIESKGRGAEVGPFTPGRGGVYDQELAGVPLTSKGEGIAASRGAKGLLGIHEKAWSEATDTPEFEYRQRAADYKKEVAAAQPEQTAPIKNLRRQKVTRPVRDVAAELPGADAKLSEIEAAHRERKAPILAEQAQADEASAEMPPRNATALRAQIEKDLYSARTSDRAAAKLQRALGILDRYTDRGTATPDDLARLDNLKGMRANVKPGGASASGLDKMIAEIEGKSGTGEIMIPEKDLNDVRAYVYGGTNIGKSDLRPASEAPQRALAGSAREMVNEGPYGPTNEKWTEAYRKQQDERKFLGLKKRPPTDRDVDVNKIAKRESLAKYMNEKADYEQKRTAADADYERQAAEYDADLTAHKKALAHAKDERAAYQSDFESSRARASKERQQLGLDDRIPRERKVDVGKIKRGLINRYVSDSHTAGEQDVPGLDEFTTAHPEAQTFQDLPQLAAARNALAIQFKLKGGTMLGALKDLVMPNKFGFAWRNRGAIQGRLLYPGASKAAREEQLLLKMLPMFQAAATAEGDQ